MYPLPHPVLIYRLLTLFHTVLHLQVKVLPPEKSFQAKLCNLLNLMQNFVSLPLFQARLFFYHLLNRLLNIPCVTPKNLMPLIRFLLNLLQVRLWHLLFPKNPSFLLTLQNHVCLLLNLPDCILPPFWLCLKVFFCTV